MLCVRRSLFDQCSRGLRRYVLDQDREEENQKKHAAANIPVADVLLVFMNDGAMAS
jgi:hypothetical protein